MYNVFIHLYTITLLLLPLPKINCHYKLEKSPERPNMNDSLPWILKFDLLSTPLNWRIRYDGSVYLSWLTYQIWRFSIYVLIDVSDMTVQYNMSWLTYQIWRFSIFVLIDVSDMTVQYICLDFLNFFSWNFLGGFLTYQDKGTQFLSQVQRLISFSLCHFSVQSTYFQTLSHKIIHYKDI